MPSPRKALITHVALWAFGHILWSALAIACFQYGNIEDAEILTWFVIGWQPLMAVAIYGETRNAWRGSTDETAIAFQSLAVMGLMVLGWMAVH